MRKRHHGGRPPPGLLDFSTPLNPLGPPPSLREAIPRLSLEASMRYPDYEYREFREAVASYYSLDPDNVIPLNGAAEILQLALLALKPRSLVSIEPTFGDHGFTLESLGIHWTPIPLKPAGGKYVLDPSLVCSLGESVREGSILLLSNPNNPTGSHAPARVVEELSECMSGGIVILDEAFIELGMGWRESLLGRAPDNVVVVRSLTKTLALPGLRIGFAYTGDKRLARLLDSSRQPWNVNTLAALVTVEALTTYAEETRAHTVKARALVESEAPWLKRQLEVLGLEVYESTTPFLLVRHSQLSHPTLQRELGRWGVYVRDASSFTYLTPYHSRVSVRLREENMVLVEAFRRVLESHSSGS